MFLFSITVIAAESIFAASPRVKVPDGIFVIILHEENGLIKVLSAADYYGYSLNKIDSIPIYYSEKDYYFDVVFKGNGELDKFLLWLELEMPGYEIIGIYKHIKATNGKVGG